MRANQRVLSKPVHRLIPQTEKAPRVVHSANRSLIEQGAWKIKRLRRQHIVELHPWSSPQSLPSAPAEPHRVNRDRDPLALARLYQGLIDAGIAKNRAEVARYFGVSRARVTQVLRRLDGNGDVDNGGGRARE